jgi:hypothetical protein
MTEWGIDTLFNPGKRHMDEEKRRLQSTREEIGDASGGRRIDLESGTVKISRKPKADQPAEADASNDPAASDTAHPDDSAASDGPAASDDPAAAAAEGSRGTTDVNSADTQVMPTRPD